MAKLKRTTKRTLFISISLVVVLVCAFVAFHLISTKQVKAVYEEELDVLNGIITSNTRQVYVTSRDIKYGEVISTDDITEVSALASLDSSMFFTSTDIGSVALVDIPVGTVITTNMITYEDCDDTLRETEFDVLVLNSNLKDGDFVDVRIRYQNGEDYVVLSKKCVKNLSLHNAVCYMNLMEEETQLISSAIVDASVYGAVLYTTTYLEPSIQEQSVITYQPSADILKIIYNNPNILTVATENLSAVARAEMQQRLSAYNNMISNGGSGGNIFNVTDIPDIDNVGNMQSEYIEIEEQEAVE